MNNCGATDAASGVARSAKAASEMGWIAEPNRRRLHLALCASGRTRRPHYTSPGGMCEKPLLHLNLPDRAVILVTLSGLGALYVL